MTKTETDKKMEIDSNFAIQKPKNAFLASVVVGMQLSGKLKPSKKMKRMIKNNLSEKYSKAIIIIHWLSFLLIMALIPVGFIMSYMENGETKLILLRVHIIAGILVCILTLLRVWFFFRHKRPSKLETGRAIHNKLVVWIENSFYFILILLSISGIATVILGNFVEAIQNSDATLLPQTNDIPPAMAHKALAFILIILLLGHVGGVINHYIKTKENTLKRITS